MRKPWNITSGLAARRLQEWLIPGISRADESLLEDFQKPQDTSSQRHKQTCRRRTYCKTLVFTLQILYFTATCHCTKCFSVYVHIWNEQFRCDIMEKHYLRTRALRCLSVSVTDVRLTAFELIWDLLQGVVGDAGERGPPGPDGNQVRVSLPSALRWSLVSLSSTNI